MIDTVDWVTREVVKQFEKNLGFVAIIHRTYPSQAVADHKVPRKPMTVADLKEYLEALPDDMQVDIEGGGGPEETWPTPIESVRIRLLDRYGLASDTKSLRPVVVLFG